MSQKTNGTRLITAVLVALGALVIFPAFFMGFGMMGFGPMMGGMWGGGMWGNGTTSWMFIVGIVMQLLFIAALVGGGYLLYRAVAGSGHGPDQALEELRVAYARGDLTEDEYEQRREALERDAE